MPKRETIQELVDQSPGMTQDHWDDLANLARRHECIPALLGHMLSEATIEATRLINISNATPEGREQSDMIKGLARGYQAFVGNCCYLMGDGAEEDEAAAGAEPQEQRQPRRRRAPVKKTAKKVTRRKS